MIKKISLNLFWILAFPSLQANLFAITHSVAVMPFENVNKDSSLDWLSMGIPETVTNSLLAVKGLVLVERLQLRKVMDEQKLQLTGAIDDKTIVKVGKLIGANILVVGAFQKQADNIRLTARFVDIESGGVLQTAQATGKMDNIFDLQDNIVKDLAKNLNIELKQEELAKISEKPTESLEAYQHFGQGALLQAKKDYQGAVKELQKATGIDPKFSLAKNKFVEAFLSLNKGNYWTYESVSSGKYGSRAQITNRAGEITTCAGQPCFTYIRQMAGNGDKTGNVYSTEVQYYEKGKDGIYMAASETQGNLVSGQSGNFNYRTTYDPPYLVYPYELEVGKEWSSESKTRMGSAKFKYTVHHRVTKKETITIQSIGDVECFIIESEGLAKSWLVNVKADEREWFSPGIGIVKMEMNLSGRIDGLTDEMVLKEFHVE